MEDDDIRGAVADRLHVTLRAQRPPCWLASSPTFGPAFVLTAMLAGSLAVSYLCTSKGNLDAEQI